MKQALIVLLLIGLTVWGHFAIPSFDSYLLMMALISVLIIAHELGHFTVAKKVGVKVERFGFGLPIGPTLLEKQIGDTKFCLHPVLLGGYVSFPDDDPDSSIPPDSPLRFENKSIAARAAIAVAGVAVNFALGYLIMVFVIGFWGYPSRLVTIHHLLSETSPAAVAGLKANDIMLQADGQEVKSQESFAQYINQHKETPVKLLIERDGVQKTVTVTPNKEGRISVALTEIHRHVPEKNPLMVLGKAYTFLYDNVVMNFKAMGEIFTGQRSTKEVSGPVGIIKQGGQIIDSLGIYGGLVLTALISVILGVMNILPIPMLDGGHLLFMLFEKIKGEPLRKETQERVIQFSFIVLIGLMCLIMWNDINTHILGN